MMVADASTLPVVGRVAARKRGIAHWYQLGEAPPAPGFAALSSLYRDGEAPPVAEVGGDDPFAVISTAAVDVIPRGAVLTHRNMIAAPLVVVQSLGFRPSIAICSRCRCFTSPRSAIRGAPARGRRRVLVARYDAEEAVRLIDAHRITHLSDFPPVLVNLLDAAQKSGASCRA